MIYKLIKHESYIKNNKKTLDFYINIVVLIWEYNEII